MNLIVRDERPGDADAIRTLNLEAFGGPLEGQIVDTLRANEGVSLSLVAIVDGLVAGHILYSPASIGPEGQEVRGAALGPMAVAPAHQRMGIGSRLVEAGNARLRETGCPFIIVLGHAAYYPRFGFEPAAGRGIRCEWPVPDDVFMVLVLDRDRMKGVSGLARYRREFSMPA